MHCTRDCFVFFATLVFARLSSQCSNYGYPFENHLSTLTPYRLVGNKSFERIHYEGCVPQKIWLLIRHGTRYPKYSAIEQMNSRLPDIKDLLIDSGGVPNEFVRNRDFDLLKKWKLNLETDKNNKLTQEGDEEMLILAERMQSRFPLLFDDVYSNTSYKFKHTHSQRTKRSAYFFAAGLFGKNTAKDVWFPDPLKKDPILRFYKLCDRWNIEVKKNPSAQEEGRIFENGPEISEVVEDVNRRLNLKENRLNLGDVKLIYDMCSFETAWNKLSKSPWCSILSHETIRVLEYAKDLRYYWQDGYGHELTYKQACPAFKDMFNFLQNKNRFPRVNAYFTHSGTMLKLLAHLGLYKDDEHLTAKNYDSMGNRLWRTSLIDAFGSNVAFISFGCGSENKVLAMHQENIVRLPACPDSDLCDINSIRDYYYQSLSSCDFSSMCRIK